jgi:N5-(cytidine 5'-diphosphoramidyl)-L-glutamine hydrolase
MKRVAVSQRVDRFPERQERRDALDQRIATWLERAGVLAFPVPNQWSAANNLRAWLDALQPEAVVLSGGEDLHQTPERDDTERALLRFAGENRLPMLGLCRGLQMMSVFAGGTLERLPDHAGCRHALVAANCSELSSAVNSFHAWGLKACPPGYEVLARAPDGSIEAIRHMTLPWEGWMWHPERESVFAASELSRLQSLLDNR